MTAPAEYTDLTRHGHSDNVGKGERALWCAVLTLAIDEALNGSSTAGEANRHAETTRAQHFFTLANPDLPMICHLIGLDPVAVRQNVARRIKAGPTVDELLAGPKRRQRQPRTKQR
ncbi:MAG: hypothetical protein KDK26_15180 [Roseivivax sp.]|nr:hypothetical protein [Roseivivax sp.]